MQQYENPQKHYGKQKKSSTEDYIIRDISRKGKFVETKADQ
jgi:hypothetical protein